MKTPNVPIVSTYTPKRATCPMIFAPTEFRIAERTMMPPAMMKIVLCFAGSKCVLNKIFENDVT